MSTRLQLIKLTKEDPTGVLELPFDPPVPPGSTSGCDRLRGGSAGWRARCSNSGVSRTAIGGDSASLDHLPASHGGRARQEVPEDPKHLIGVQMLYPQRQAVSPIRRPRRR